MLLLLSLSLWCLGRCGGGEGEGEGKSEGCGCEGDDDDDEASNRDVPKSSRTNPTVGRTLLPHNHRSQAQMNSSGRAQKGTVDAARSCCPPGKQ